MTELIFDECEERRRRERNIVIFGLAEKPFGTLEERKKNDADQLTFLSEVLNLQQVDMHHFHRLGRGNSLNAGVSRPLLVKLNSIADKVLFLKSSSTLKKFPQYRSVFIHPDLTRMQQNKRKQLRLELRGRRDRGEDVVISRNRVVNKKTSQGFL